MKKTTFLFVAYLLLSGFQKPINKFTDETLRQIYTFQDARNTDALIPFLKNENENYREAAALAFASVQDTSAIEKLVNLLNDKSEKVRRAAAFALGQMKYKGCETFLMNSFATEKSVKVKSEILTALGKCGSAKTLSWLASLSLTASDSILMEGQAWALFHFSNRKIISEEGTKKAVALIDKQMPYAVKLAASAYLARVRGLDLTPFATQLLESIRKDTAVFIQMNIARSLGKVKDDKARAELEKLISSKADYRVKVNAINALKGFQYVYIKKTLSSQVNNSNNHVSYSAAELLLSNGDSSDAHEYFAAAIKCKYWRTRASLYAAALKYSAPDSMNAIVSKRAMDIYKKSENVYEKGALLSALGQDIENHPFIAKEVFSTRGGVLSTYGMDALVNIRKSQTFEKYANKVEGGGNLYKTFAHYFKKGMESGDVAMVGIAAGILMDTTVALPATGANARAKILSTLDGDYSFLKTAMSKLSLPRDIETANALQEAIDFFEGGTKTANKPAAKNRIDWNLVSTIPTGQKAILKTSKGNIVLQLFVDEAPGSVANFISLEKKGFYDGKVFHRVVPNFVAQAGCPRGDGWGNSDETIRSEFSYLRYGEGYLGMASAGKDTEGCQWFITHSPTPHLDGNYSIFGKVMEGMNVVHNLDVGDIIVKIEF